MAGVVVITDFDSEVTLLYKYAQVLGRPIKYIIVTRPQPSPDVGTMIRPPSSQAAVSPRLALEQLRFEAIFDVVEQKIKQGQNLAQVYSDLHSDLTPVDMAMVYYSTRLDPTLTEVVLRTINQFYSNVGISAVLSLETLNATYRSWSDQYKRLYQTDLVTLASVNQIHQELAGTTGLPTSMAKIDHITVGATPRLRVPPDKDPGPGPGIEDGLDIFNVGVVSFYVPFIQFNGDRDKYFKLFKGDTPATTPDYSVVVRPSTQTNKKNTIYMTVWSGTGTPAKATKESFKKATYSLEKNRLTIESPVREDQDERTLADRLQASLPLVIDQISEIKVGGEFYIYGVEYEEITFTHAILNEPVINAYLYIDETGKSYADKKRLVIRYRTVVEGLIEEDKPTGEGYITNPSSVNVLLTQLHADKDEMVSIEVPGGLTQNLHLPQGTAYIKINILRAVSRAVISQFKTIFPRLLQVYSQKRPQLEQFYRQYIPGIGPLLQVRIPTPVTPVGKTKRKTKDGIQSKINQMKELAPDLAVEGYARACQCQRQPIIIPQDEVAAWQAKTIVFRNNRISRQVMPFPKDKPKWLFVCPNDERPFPGVKANNTLSNRDIYPFVPCCFKDDQTVQGQQTGYNAYYRDQAPKIKTTAKAKHLHKTNRILKPGERAILPESIVKLVKHHSDNPGEIIRYGVVRSPNSLIHCLLEVIGGEQYRQANDVVRERLAIQYREGLTKTIQPGLLRQELYDATEDEIKRQLADFNRFLDPALYYRALEEASNVNIFVLTPVGEGKDELEIVEIPRAKLFHSRPVRLDRQTLLIYKHGGAESDIAQYPQCEIIADFSPADNRFTLVYGRDMSQIMFEALQTISKTFSWDIDLTTNQPVARENIYSIVNYYTLLGGKDRVKGQIIDNYGKLRGLVANVSTDQTPTDITMLFPASQPENLPMISLEPNSPLIEVVIAVFDSTEITAVTRDANITGLWYRILDIDFGAYFPVRIGPESGPIVDQLQDAPTGPPNPIFTQDQDVVKRIKKLRRVVRTILQLVLWVFQLSGESSSTFISNYLGLLPVADLPPDSQNIYDLSKINHRLPIVKTAREAMDFLTKVAPTLVKQGRFAAYSQKLAGGFIYFLIDYEKSNRGLTVTPAKEIDGLFEEELDFIQRDNVALFVNEADMRAWLYDIQNAGFKNIHIRNKLDISFGLLNEPYLYEDIDGKIYIIKNVLGGDKLRALNVAYQLYLTKINIGFHSPSLDNPLQIPVYATYGISRGFTAIPIEDKTNERTEFLQILSYGEAADQYAAMIPIL